MPRTHESAWKVGLEGKHDFYREWVLIMAGCWDLASRRFESILLKSRRAIDAYFIKNYIKSDCEWNSKGIMRPLKRIRTISLQISLLTHREGATEIPIIQPIMAKSQAWWSDFTKPNSGPGLYLDDARGSVHRSSTSCIRYRRRNSHLSVLLLFLSSSLRSHWRVFHSSQIKVRVKHETNSQRGKGKKSKQGKGKGGSDV